MWWEKGRPLHLPHPRFLFTQLRFCLLSTFWCAGFPTFSCPRHYDSGDADEEQVGKNPADALWEASVQWLDWYRALRRLAHTHDDGPHTLWLAPQEDGSLPHEVNGVDALPGLALWSHREFVTPLVRKRAWQFLQVALFFLDVFWKGWVVASWCYVLCKNTSEP